MCECVFVWAPQHEVLRVGMWSRLIHKTWFQRGCKGSWCHRPLLFKILWLSVAGGEGNGWATWRWPSRWALSTSGKKPPSEGTGGANQKAEPLLEGGKARESGIVLECDHWMQFWRETRKEQDRQVGSLFAWKCRGLLVGSSSTRNYASLPWHSGPERGGGVVTSKS